MILVYEKQATLEAARAAVEAMGHEARVVPMARSAGDALATTAPAAILLAAEFYEIQTYRAIAEEAWTRRIPVVVTGTRARLYAAFGAARRAGLPFWSVETPCGASELRAALERAVAEAPRERIRPPRRAEPVLAAAAIFAGAVLVTAPTAVDDMARLRGGGTFAPWLGPGATLLLQAGGFALVLAGARRVRSPRGGVASAGLAGSGRTSRAG